jgi:hypothetical protein
MNNKSTPPPVRIDELIWSGRVHLGDEAGVYGNVTYSGLTVEYPVTVKPFPADQGATPRTPDLVFLLQFEEVNVISGYRGHKVTVIGYRPSAVQYHWDEFPLSLESGDDRVTSNTHLVRLKNPPDDIMFLSIQIRLDTQPMPNLYNNCLWRRLSLRSGTHYATFGFHS